MCSFGMPIVALVLFFTLVSFPSIEAHNWSFGLGRSRDIASTQTPCPARRQPGPHVQVGPNQEFEIEWSVGHSTPSYYVIIKSTNEGRLNEVSFDSLDTYLREAPNARCKNLPVYHRRFAFRGANFRPHSEFYSGEILPNSPNFIPRPESFGPWGDGAKLFGYKNALEVRNYCEYTNNKMPFIEGVFKFDHYANRPQDADMVRLKIPGVGGFGAYTIQWLWRGYRDCIDVDYRPNRIANIYGRRNPAGSYTRMDHCYFPNPREVFDCFRIFNDRTICERACDIRAGNCAGFTVMPRELVASRYNGEANLLPALCRNTIKKNQLGEPATKVDVCFTVRPRRTSETFGITDVVKPGDPAYHSTCYRKGTGRLFENFTPPPQHQDIPWRHGDECISCDAVNLNKNITRVPKWPITNDCRNCDLEPKRNTPRFNPSYLSNRRRNVFCDGFNGDYQVLPNESNKRHHKCNGDTFKTCHKKLLMRGRPSPWNERLWPAECAEAAKRDSQCSTKIYTYDLSFQYKDQTAMNCYCVVRRGCCRGCRTRRPATVPERWNVYELVRGTD